MIITSLTVVLDKYVYVYILYIYIHTYIFSFCKYILCMLFDQLAVCITVMIPSTGMPYFL